MKIMRNNNRRAKAKYEFVKEWTLRSVGFLIYACVTSVNTTGLVHSLHEVCRKIEIEIRKRNEYRGSSDYRWSGPMRQLVHTINNVNNIMYSMYVCVVVLLIIF